MKRALKIEIVEIIGIIIVVGILISLLFFIGNLIFQENKKKEILIEEQKIIINQQALKIETLKRNCKWANILEQILPPISQDELSLMEEQIEQWRIKKNLLK